ncbi:MAG: nucleotidyltransferase family protein [Dyella sp.]|nr:nucleotidyltransferase family protein [Dyella sp.]
MTHADARIGAVLLAAGSASRFGAPKQVLAIDGVPMVRRAAIAALNAGLSPVVVVTGAHGDVVAESLAGLDVHVIAHADWASGMGSSLAAGIKAFDRQVPSSQAVMVLLADQPSIGAEDLKRMLEAHALVPERILAARYDGHLGPPCLFPRTYFSDLAALDGPSGARRLLEKYAARVDAHDLQAAAFDIDTPADHASWQAGRHHDPSDR